MLCCCQPEGYRVDRNKPVVIDLSGADKNFLSDSVQIDIPTDIVEDSAAARFELIGIGLLFQPCHLSL